MRVALWNIGAMTAALALAFGLTWHGTATEASDTSGAEQGETFLVDAGGHRIPLRRYRRILSASMVTDRLLLDLCEPDRIVGFSRNSVALSPWAYRFAGKPLVAELEDVEAVLALAPDLVLVHNVGDARRVAKLREQGLAVFDMGRMQGLDTLMDDIRTVAKLVGHPERGENYVTHLRQRLRAIAADIPAHARRGALYVSLHGTTMYGGTRGTSYHDVLRFAGLVDVAAGRFEGWPAYTPEELLLLDPPMIVTGTGMRDRLCRHAGLSGLRACAKPARIIEMPNALLSDPGPGMVEAAERLRRAVYGMPDAQRPAARAARR